LQKKTKTEQLEMRKNQESILPGGHRTKLFLEHLISNESIYFYSFFIMTFFLNFLICRNNWKMLLKILIVF
jgi:hypothetical protein